MSIGNVSSFFTQTAKVYRPTISQAATGAMLQTWSSQSEVSGCLRPYIAYRWGSELISGDKVTDTSNYRWYCATTADIHAEDRLLISGLYYRVVYPADAMSMGKLMHCDVKLVAHDG